MNPRILIVDDEELIRWSLTADLAAAGYSASSASDMREALALIEKDPPAIVLADLRLGADNGLEMLKTVRRTHPEVPVVLMTAYADVASAVEALREGAADYILKPLQLDALQVTLRRALEHSTLRRRVDEAQRRQRTRYNFSEIVAESPGMRRALETARKLADCADGTILLLGESGTGKDLLARAIHYESPRASQPFMEITATAIPENLLESELFGHEKGAFTGAAGRKPGLFELAAGGTVFLNEVGHMPATLQPKLLRVLEEKAFRRVGGLEDLTVDVRVLAATNEDLERAVAAGRFRADLYYRLNVLAIRLPPLRDRPQDLPALVDRLLERLSADLRGPSPPVSPQLMSGLRAYDWPGNVRELRNFLERMLILGDASLPQGAREAAGAAESRAGAVPALPAPGLRLEEVERDLVRQALERAAGSRRKAAGLLGLSRDALRRRMEKFGLLGERG